MEQLRKSKYLIEGRVIPERVDLNIPKISYLVHYIGGPVGIDLQVLKSKIFVYIESDEPIYMFDLRNIIFTQVGDLINYIGFRYVLGLAYEIDSITDIEEKTTHVFGVEGFVFEPEPPQEAGHTFKKNNYGPATLDMRIASNPSVARATFELRNSIRYPDYTALHCYLAIEAIRNYFQAENENESWEELRKNLNVAKSVIMRTKDTADLQRHGRNKPQNWSERQTAMQTSWELLHRFVYFLQQEQQVQLDKSEFPILQ